MSPKCLWSGMARSLAIKSKLYHQTLTSILENNPNITTAAFDEQFRITCKREENELEVEGSKYCLSWDKREDMIDAFVFMECIPNVSFTGFITHCDCIY